MVVHFYFSKKFEVCIIKMCETAIGVCMCAYIQKGGPAEKSWGPVV